MTLLAIVAFPVVMFAPDASSPGYKGADAAVKLLVESTPEDVAPPTPREVWRKGLEEFQTRNSKLAPNSAAKEWLGFLDRLQALPPDTAVTPFTSPVGFGTLVEALPPPASWKAIREELDRRLAAKASASVRDKSLALFGRVLVDDRAGQRQLLADLEAAARTAQDWDRYAKYSLPRLRASLDVQADQTLTEKLDSQVEASNGYQAILLPDLVTLESEATARAQIQRLLRKPGAKLAAPPGPTLALARQLALESMPDLPNAQWALAANLEGVELFEAGEKRFLADERRLTGTSSKQGSADLVAREYGEASLNDARTWYVAGLVARGRSSEASAALKRLMTIQPDTEFAPALIAELSQSKKADAFFELVRGLLKDDPGIPLWNTLVALASRTGRQAELLDLLQRASDRSGLEPAQRIDLRMRLARAQLSADKLDEAVQTIRSLQAEKLEKLGGSAFLHFLSERARLSLSLARVGSLLGKEAWREEGIRSVFADLKGAPPTSLAQIRIELVQVLVENGEGPRAEALLLEALASKRAQPSFGSHGDVQSSVSELVPLLFVYHSAGRSEDVLRLLESAPGWGALDLVDLLDSEGYRHNGDDGDRSPSIGYMAAVALHDRKRDPEATRVLRAVIERQPGLDGPYELLAKIEGATLLPWLDEQSRRDRFEERPLIWKAQLLLDRGDHEGAILAARSAIAIDPSDGEEGRGDRLRAYSVLAAALSRKGDKLSAKTYDEAVRAIRMSEDADRLFRAGLTLRAVEKYAASLTVFADAYCIQSRLALRLEEAGRLEEASKHYSRAYELMPESFGRVESHCFGCEGVFRSGRAQSIADRVFGRLAKERKDDARVHYLLGYLREEQGRVDDALREFREATRLDPDYLNAWSRLSAIAARGLATEQDRSASALSLIRLDPAGRHARSDVSEVRDLKALWAAFEQHPVRPGANETVLSLPASSREIELRMGMTAAQFARMREQRLEHRERYSSAGNAISKHEAVSAIGTFAGL